MGREIIVVSGLPRSGTSMMMRILEKGGVGVLTDNIRQADESNLSGYYEFERVKQIEEDKTWLPNAVGKAVKLISALLRHLPPDYTYKVIFMRRDLDEILASQKRMLERMDEKTDGVSDETMKRLYKTHIAQIEEWLANQPNFDTIYISYNDTVSDPTTSAEEVANFLNRRLDIEAMVGVVDPGLYRQRK